MAGHLAWCQTAVQGRPASYATAGSGSPVLFLHGWALGHHTYKRALKRLVQQGSQVVAPALPGFGGTPNLPGDRLDFSGYASWVSEFLDRLGYEEPLLAVGHSFGGAVAAQLAHDHPRHVRQLVLVNSLGGSVWRQQGAGARLMSERPLWDWGIRFPADLWPPLGARWLVGFFTDDLVANLIRNPLGVWRAAELARRADLSTELGELRRRGLSALALSAEHDGIVPRASFDALCQALGCEGQVVPGRHSWLLADPDAFGRALADAVAALQERGAEEGAAGDPPGDQVA